MEWTTIVANTHVDNYGILPEISWRSVRALRFRDRFQFIYICERKLRKYKRNRT